MSQVQNAINANATTPLSPTDGGTGVSNPTTHGILIANGSSAVTSQVLTNGQLLIGDTGSAPQAATLTAGSNITITNGAGTISIAASGVAGFTSVVIQKFTSSGTYTPTSGMVYAVVEVVGGGGNGGSALNGSAQAGASGGGGGEYAKGVFDAATVGASQTVTIGSSGGTTSLGSLITAVGGANGGNSASSSTLQVAGSTAGGSGGTGGSFRVKGQPGWPGLSGGFSDAPSAGLGASGIYGSGGQPGYPSSGNSSNGGAGSGYGSGGAGGAMWNSGTTATGGSGASGICIITEYIS